MIPVRLRARLNEAVQNAAKRPKRGLCSPPRAANAAAKLKLRMTQTPHFEPTLAAMHAKIAAIRPQQYAKTRNDLNGAVTRLSPYFTHGFTDAGTVIRQLNAHAPQRLHFDDKIVFEFAWRSFFQHVWAHQGDAIFADLGEPVCASEYASAMPHDVLTATTGVPAIDCAVRELYATGYLHNHARMWLASYVVHLRKISWQAGAAWMYAHLLDGDLASNHLSWQWVAGTFANKPYLFNAENVARFTPAASHAHWRSEGTVIDQSYEALDAWARSARCAKAQLGQREACTVPSTGGVPLAVGASLNLPALQVAVRGQAVWLVHPWNLGDAPQGAVVVAWLCPEFHARHPWSVRRWDWVLARMRALSSSWVLGDATALGAALSGAAQVRVLATPHRAYRDAFAKAALQHPQFCSAAPPQWLPAVAKPCRSFTSYYQAARKQAKDLESCL